MQTKRKWGPENLKAAQLARRAPKQTLTDRERAFCQGLVGGLTTTAALRKAGYAPDARPRDILERPLIVAYIKELRERQVTRLDYSIDNLCARLEHIAYAAIDDKQFAPAVAAMMGIAKMMGHLADRTEIEMHIISKPARETTKEITLSPEAWQRQFAPKIAFSPSDDGYGAAGSRSPSDNSKARSSPPDSANGQSSDRRGSH